MILILHSKITINKVLLVATPLESTHSHPSYPSNLWLFKGINMDSICKPTYYESHHPIKKASEMQIWMGLGWASFFIRDMRSQRLHIPKFQTMRHSLPSNYWKSFWRNHNEKNPTLWIYLLISTIWLIHKHLVKSAIEKKHHMFLQLVIIIKIAISLARQLFRWISNLKTK
jgi:uncharacterized protein with PQ loop repeat